MKMARHVVVSLFAGAWISACGPVRAPSSPDAGQPTDPATPQRTLVVIARGEPPSLASKPLVGFSGSLNPPIRLFNATLDRIDDKRVAHPYLVTELPRLNTDTWRLMPDGRMETTHRLRPNLTWHDGAPLSADDFVFGWQVFSAPELGASQSEPIRQMEEIVAPDPETVVIRWRVPYPDAAQMDATFQPLPRHILGDRFAQLDPPEFVNLPFWTVEYVGLGPYRVTAWEPGAFLEATAFAGHALGKPKIDRLRLEFIGDPNTALAKMLSGDAHYVADFVLDYDLGQTLEKEWSSRGGGTVFYAPVLLRLTEIQLRPEIAQPRALLDARVRAGLAYAFDVPGAVDVFTGGHGVATSTLTSPLTDYYPIVENAITKRDYNPRTAQQQLEAAGMVRGADGFYAGPGGEPFKVDIWTTGGAVFERENRIFADSLRQAGIDATPQTMTPARLADAEARALTPGLFTGGAGNRRLEDFTLSKIPRPENRWNGNNRGAWRSSEYDRLFQEYATTLDPSERVERIAAMEHVLNEDVGAIPHMFTTVVTANSSQLAGPKARMDPDAPLTIYDVESWSWRS
ncbi:MAG TPA: ABC transporter substrate-binding protein [Chloroflexota bacterium]|nr:ABC transporter substrate-binding protein [Chloroflexota bacterium]